MNDKEYQYQLGRLSGLKEACELTGVINTGKKNYQPLLTLIRELNIKLQGTTVHDCECKGKARELVNAIEESNYYNDGYLSIEEAEGIIKQLFNLEELTSKDKEK